jgi:hypothetical protein
VRAQSCTELAQGRNPPPDRVVCPVHRSILVRNAGRVTVPRLGPDSAAGKLRERVAEGHRALVVTVALCAVPAVLVFFVSGIVLADEDGSFRSAQVWPRLTELTKVFAEAQDPMETVGALAAIAVAIIFYNARVELPDPDSTEAADEDLERTSTILRTKSVLRIVAAVIAMACWLLLVAVTVQVIYGVRTVFNAVEIVALAALILVSCNFVVSQREEIAGRSLLALDAAVTAYTSTEQRRASQSLDGRYKSLKKRAFLLALAVCVWLGLSLGLSREPITTDAVILSVGIVIAAVGLHLTVLGLAGAARVSWRRRPFLAWLLLTSIPLAVAYVSLVGSIVAPPVSSPDPRDRVFFGATLILFVLIALACWPMGEVTATWRARRLRAYIATRRSRAATSGNARRLVGSVTI